MVELQSMLRQWPARLCQYGDCEINRCVWIEREARQIQSKPPIENIVERKIAEIAQTIRA